MIYTTKDLISGKDYKTIFGVAIALLIIGFIILILFSNLLVCVYFLGVSVLLTILAAKMGSYSKSYISLYNDRIEGLSMSRSDVIITIRYEDIKKVSVSQDLNKVIVYDKYGNFTFQAHNCAKTIADMIYENQRGLHFCPRCQKRFNQAFCPICGYVAKSN